MTEHNSNPDAFEDDCPTQVSEAWESSADPGELNDAAQDAVLSALLSRQSGPSLSDRPGERVLEVNQVWGSTLLDTRHVKPREGRVTIGSRVGYRWSLLGVDLGWVSRPLALVLPYAPPMWSEIESRPRSDFLAPTEAAERDLFRFEGGRWVADLAPGWEGFVERDGQRVSHDGDTRGIELLDGDVFMAERDGVIIHARTVPQSKRVPLALFAAIDWFFLGLLGITASVALAFGMLIAFLPSPPVSDAYEVPDRFAQAVLRVEKVDKVVAHVKAPVASPEKAIRAEGVRGRKIKTGRRVARGAAQRHDDRLVAENSGLLGVLRNMGANQGMGGAVSRADLDGIGGLTGPKGVQVGTFGLGRRGDGFGGGGELEGIGGICASPPCGPGVDAVGLSVGIAGGSKVDGVVLAKVDQTVIIGALDKSQIERIIKQHIGQIRYCYQRQLQRDPGLNGKMVSRFVIAKDGTVSSSTTARSSIGNNAVTSCVEGRIARMHFPKPRGGGIVVVSYPFMFTGG